VGEIVITRKSLQIISQNTSILMPYDNSVINEQGDTFSIGNPYKLNCNESKMFTYICEVRFLTDGTYAWKTKYPKYTSSKQ
jgi:hypothetical protein